MDKTAIREMVITKVAEEMYLERKIVIEAVEELEQEIGDHLYEKDTIAEVVARVLDRMDGED